MMEIALSKNILMRRLLIGVLAAFSLVPLGCNSKSPVEPEPQTETIPQNPGPRISSISPSGTIDKKLPDSVVVRFSDEIRVVSFQFNIVPDVPGVTSIADSTLVFKPTFRFVLGIEYNASLSLLATDSKNQTRLIDTNWTFQWTLSPILYVRKGASGDGSRDNPFGSIQLALDKAFNDEYPFEIYVAGGAYLETPVIRSEVTLSGGHDPILQWNVTNISPKTIIAGKLVAGMAIGLMIRDVDARVTLDNLTIESRNAITQAAESYGLYCGNSSDVVIRNCFIKSGQGGPGIDGADGVSGNSGDSVVVSPGGKGGRGALNLQDNWDRGERGFCASGSQTGGIGGEALFGGHGRVGPIGNTGVNGAGVNSRINPITNKDSLLILPVAAGIKGDVGGFGCGGGGGGGAMANCSPLTGHCDPGGSGHLGGNGGGPGFGGAGGGGGGSSVSVVILNSNLSITTTTLHTSRAGHGGIGGSGGVGGAGQQGELAGPNEGLLPGGNGGDGGAGGRGGHGGGGAGGWSIGALLVNSILGDTSNVNWILAPAGAGGFSPGNSGEAGKQVSLYTLVP